jgi:hypothetical protein
MLLRPQSLVPLLCAKAAVCSTVYYSGQAAYGVSSNPGVATVDASGNVTAGITAGATSTLVYNVRHTGCMTTKPIVVNPLPAPIAGAMTVCQGATTVLSDATSGGTWNALSSGATVDATGAYYRCNNWCGDRYKPIAYTLPTGCSVYG